MPSSFGTGLMSGIVDGWTKQSEQMGSGQAAEAAAGHQQQPRDHEFAGRAG